MTSAALGLLLLLSASPIGSGTGANTIPVRSPAGLASFEWQSITSPQYAGESFRVAIIARDENGASYDYDGTAFLSTSLGSYVQPPILQFYNGVCDTSVIVTLAEDLSLRCFTDSASGLSDEIEMLEGAPKKLVAILPGEQLAPGLAGGRTGDPENRTAGDTFSFQVYLTDEWFNQVEMGGDSVYFGSDDRFGQLPAAGQLSNGTGSFTVSLRTAGQRRIFALPALGESLLADTSSAVNVVSGPFARMLLVAPGETLASGDTTLPTLETPGKTGNPSPQFLQTPFAVTVYPCDRCWNMVAGPGDTVLLRSDFPFAFAPAGVELRDSAVFDSVQFNTAGPNQSVWVVDQANDSASYVTRLNIRAIGEALQVTAPDTVRSGETTPVLVRVLDANGDPIVAALVQCSVVTGTGTMTEPALLTDTLGYTTAHFVCTPSPASEQDSIRIRSGNADTVIGIYVKHLSDSLFCFPNPFGNIPNSFGRTQIFYSLHRASSVKLTVFDPFGNEIWSRSYLSGEPGAMFGDNTVYWDGTNSKGQRVASGIYVIQALGRTGTVIDFKSLYRVGVVW